MLASQRISADAARTKAHETSVWDSERGGTGACVRCEEAGTRPSARVGLAMSVFTHGVTQEDKTYLLDRNQVFPVVEKETIPDRMQRPYGRSCSRLYIAVIQHVRNLAKARELQFRDGRQKDGRPLKSQWHQTITRVLRGTRMILKFGKFHGLLLILLGVLLLGLQAWHFTQPLLLSGNPGEPDGTAPTQTAPQSPARRHPISKVPGILGGASLIFGAFVFYTHRERPTDERG